MTDFEKKIKEVADKNNPLLDINIEAIKGAAYWVSHLSSPMLIENISKCEFNDIKAFVKERDAVLSINLGKLNLAVTFNTKDEAQDYLDKKRMVRYIHHYDSSQEELPI